MRTILGGLHVSAQWQDRRSTVYCCQMPRSITQLVFDGVADGPVAVALDIVGAAKRVTKAGLSHVPKGQLPSRVRLVSMDGKPVRTAAGRELPVDGPFALRGLGTADVLVLPGLWAATPREIAAALERPDIARGSSWSHGSPRDACSSPARALPPSCSLRPACSTGVRRRRPGGSAPRSKRFPRVTLRTDRMVIASERVLTAGSAFAHADLMLAILAQTVSPSLAHLVASYLVLDERASQARYMVIDHLRSAEPVLQKLERFINANIQRQLTLEQVARATATSPRTLARRTEQALGTTPLRFAQRLRVAQAVHLLETTPRSNDEIAGRVGYADAAAFRPIFRRETGESPRARRPRR